MSVDGAIGRSSPVTVETSCFRERMYAAKVVPERTPNKVRLVRMIPESVTSRGHETFHSSD